MIASLRLSPSSADACGTTESHRAERRVFRESRTYRITHERGVVGWIRSADRSARAEHVGLVLPVVMMLFQRLEVGSPFPHMVVKPAHAIDVPESRSDRAWRCCRSRRVETEQTLDEARIACRIRPRLAGRRRVFPFVDRRESLALCTAVSRRGKPGHRRHGKAELGGSSCVQVTPPRSEVSAAAERAVDPASAPRSVLLDESQKLSTSDQV